MATLTLLGMGGVGLIVMHFFLEEPWFQILKGKADWWQQVGVGIAMGVVVGTIANWISERKFMKPIVKKYLKIFAQFDLGWKEVLWISICAGVGEELLFRGAIQPFLGIILTAIIFVAIHGYLNPKNWQISVYGLFMTGAICVFGWATERFGITSAIIAHTLVDIILLWEVKKNNEDDGDAFAVSVHSDNIDFPETLGENKP